MPKPRYKTLYDYMERTGTNATRLLQMVREKEYIIIDKTHFSMILRGSRRCNREYALALHNITGVPIEELVRWPRYAKTENSESAA